MKHMKKFLAIVLVIVMTTMTAFTETTYENFEYQVFISQVTISETLMIDDVYYKYIYLNDIFNYVIELRWLDFEPEEMEVRIFKNEKQVGNTRIVRARDEYEAMNQLCHVLDMIYEQNKLQIQYNSGKLSEEYYTEKMFNLQFNNF